MASAYVRSKIFALATGGGTQDFTFADINDNSVKGYKIEVVAATVSGTAANGASMSLGASAGGVQRSLAFVSEDAAAATNTKTRPESNSVICLLNVNAGGTIDGRFTHNSFITGGFRLNIATAPSSAWLALVTVFGGSDVQAALVEVATPTTINTATTVNSLSFQTNLMYAFGAPDTSFNDTTVDSITVSWGWCDGVERQGCCSLRWPDALATTDVQAAVSAQRVIQRLTSTASIGEVQIDAFTSVGFDAFTRGIAGVNNFAALCIDFPAEVGVEVGLFLSPLATGNQDTTLADAFQPQWVGNISTALRTLDTKATNTLAGQAGQTAFDESPNSGSVSVQSQDAVADSNCESNASTDPHHLPFTVVAGVLNRATTFSMLSNGFRLGWTNLVSTTAGQESRLIYAAVQIRSDLFESLDETVTIIDEEERQLVMHRSLGMGDTVVLVEQCRMHRLHMHQAIDEALNILDETVSVADLRRAIDEILNIEDEVEFTRALRVAIGELLEISEGVESVRGLLLLVEEELDILEGVEDVVTNVVNQVQSGGAAQAGHAAAELAQAGSTAAEVAQAGHPRGRP